MPAHRIATRHPVRWGIALAGALVLAGTGAAYAGDSATPAPAVPVTVLCPADATPDLTLGSTLTQLVPGSSAVTVNLPTVCAGAGLVVR